MSQGYTGVFRWICFLSLIGHGGSAVADQSVIGQGVTNIALGNATLYSQGYGYSVGNVGSNGTDGVSLLVGEPEAGVFFAPYVPDLTDGHFMYANAYGQLNGTNDTLLAKIWGGRANRVVYPVNLDFSALAPTSVTYQVFLNGMLQREFTRGQPIVIVGMYNYYYPVVNPLQRGRDGTLGASIVMNQAVDFVFPDLLATATGDRLFIRVNSPTNQPGPVSRVDIFGGGGMSTFWSESIALGSFYRPHRSVAGATLQAAPGLLRVGNLENTNELASVVIDLERLGSLEVQTEPFQIAAADSALLVTAVGQSGSYAYEPLGSLSFSVQGTALSIGYEQGLSPESRVTVLNKGVIVHEATTSGADAIARVNTNALIQAITAQARKVDLLAGFRVTFANVTSITISSNATAYDGDEVQFLLPEPARMEHLNTLFLSGRYVGPVTITNEVATPPEAPPALAIQRAGNQVVLRWPDPNRVYALEESVFALPPYEYYYYFYEAGYEVSYTNSHAQAVAPLARTNNVKFFRLANRPD